MIKLKKSILTVILGVLAFFACALALVLPKTAKTVSASAETNYTTVDVSVMAKLSDVYVDNGNFNLWLTLSEIDTDIQNDNVTIAGVTLEDKFNELNFFDNVMIGEKTLKELGCSGFWENVISIGVGEPQNIMRLHCHADPDTWKAAVNGGEVVFGQSEVTVKAGALIPGYTYLSGAENPTVYRATMDYVTRVPNPDLSYSRVIYGQTDVDSVQYTTEWDTTYNNAYLGVSFEGDDYLGSGEQELLFQDSKHPFSNNPNFFLNSLLVNGESGKIDYYGYFDLNDKGKGYYSFVIKVMPSEGISVTIPKGSLFPMRAINNFRKYNPHTVFALYETQKDQTFYMSADGTFIGYADYVSAQIEAYKAETGYFRPAEEAQRLEIVSEAKAALAVAETDEQITATLEAAQAEIDQLKTAAQYADEELADVKTAARADIQGYLNDETYLSEQVAERAQITEAGLAAIAAATNEDEINAAVATVKTALDGVSTKAEIVAAAKAELDAYKSDETYFDEQAAEKSTILTNAKTTIESATSKAAIDEAVAAAKAKIDEVATVDNMLESYKKEALGKVNEKKAAIDYDQYLKETHAIINELYFNAKKAIENANSNEEIDGAVEAFNKAIDEIPVINLNVDEGCGNTVGVGAVLGALCLLGGVFFAKKGKKE